MANTQSKNKDKYVEVQTEKGTRKLRFAHVGDMKAPEENICNTKCPYRKICEEIPDPRCPQNKDKTFIDFCGELGGGENDDPELVNSVPVKGTLEKAFEHDTDVFQALIKRDPMVHVKDVIESVCQGWCDNYNENYSNCNECNATCILNGLFLAKDKLIGGKLEKDPDVDLEEDDFLKLTEELEKEANGN